MEFVVAGILLLVNVFHALFDMSYIAFRLCRSIEIIWKRYLNSIDPPIHW